MTISEQLGLKKKKKKNKVNETRKIIHATRFGACISTHSFANVEFVDGYDDAVAIVTQEGQVHRKCEPHPAARYPHE